MKIYTRTGDTGTTGSFSGKRYRKDDTKIELNGLIDEVSVSLEKIRYYIPKEDKQYKQLNKIIEAMYLLGAEISMGKTTGLNKYIDKGFVEKLEEQIDDFNIKLEGFQTFNTLEALTSEESRVRVRRLERFATKLLRHEQLRETVYKYLNRLSDYLFMISVYLERIYKDGTETKV